MYYFLYAFWKVTFGNKARHVRILSFRISRHHIYVIDGQLKHLKRSSDLSGKYEYTNLGRETKGTRLSWISVISDGTVAFPAWRQRLKSELLRNWCVHDSGLEWSGLILLGNDVCLVGSIWMKTLKEVDCTQSCIRSWTDKVTRVLT